MSGAKLSPREALRYRFGPYVFDPETLELRDASGVLDLPHKPALLLRILLERAGLIVTREQIQQYCWPDTRHGVDPCINAALRQIRRCLGDVAGEPRFIETLPRKGYRFVADVEQLGTRKTSQAARRRRPQRAIAVVAAIALLLASAYVVSVRKTSPAKEMDAFLSLPDESRLAYAKARHLLDGGQTTGVSRSVALFMEVITAHPEFVSAHAGIASASLLLDDRNAARRFAMRAIQLDPVNAEAQHVLGLLHLFEDWNFHAAERHLRRAAQLDSNSSHYRVNLALALTVLGREDEALSALDFVYHTDPVEPALRADAGWVYYLSGAHERAVELCATAVELMPSAMWAEDCAQNALIELGRSGEAMARVRAALKRWGDDPGEVRWPTHGSAREQLEAYWKWRVRHLENRKERSHYLLAKLYAGLGRQELALTALEEAVSANHMAVVAISVDPAFKPLRAYPRFSRLVRRVENGRSLAPRPEARLQLRSCEYAMSNGFGMASAAVEDERCIAVNKEPQVLSTIT